MIFDYFKNIKNEIKDINSMLNNKSVFNSNVITSNIDKDVLSQLNMGYSNGEMTSGYSSAIETLASSYKEATAEANALKMATDGLAESTVKNVLAKQNWSKAEIEAAISSDTFKTAQTAATISVNTDTGATWANVTATKALSVAKKGLSILGGVALSAALSIGISALIKFADNLITTKKELEEAAETARNTIDDIKESFDTLKESTNSIKERYAELAQGVDQLNGKNLTLSDDEYKEFLDISNQLAKLFPSLTKNYDENGNAILDLSGNVDTIVSSLNDLIKAEQELANQKILENLPDIYKNLNDEVGNYNSKLKNYKTLSNVLPEEFYINNHGKTSFSFEDANGDVVAADLYDYIKEQFNKKFEEHGLEDVTATIQSNLSTGINELNIEGLENTEEYYNKLSKIYDEIRVDIIGKIQGVNSSISSEMNSFNKYVYTWLSNDWNYSQMGTGLQTAIQQMLFNSNWIKDLPKNIDSNDWNQVSEWLSNNYLNAINNIDDEKVKEKISNLFTMNLDPQEKLDLAQEVQNYFDQKSIKISLDFILDENNTDSTANLVYRVNERNNQLIGSLDSLKKSYEDAKKARQELYSSPNYVGNVDINNRPIVMNENLGGDYQTSYTGYQEYKNNDGSYEIVHFTPILPDGTVLDDESLYNYLDNVIATSQNKLDADNPENGGLGIVYKVDTTYNGGKITDSNLNNAFTQADNWDIQMHNTQAQIYDNEASALIAYNQALEENNNLKQYFKNNSIDSESEYNFWLEVTKGATSAAEAVEMYIRAKASIPNNNVDFFTDENIENINAYKNDISNLSSYLSSINENNKLSAEEMATLNIEYGIVAESVEEYRLAIVQLMNDSVANSDAMTALQEAINSCNDAAEKDRLQSLYDTLSNLNTEAQKSAESVYSLSNAVSTLESSAALLRELDEVMNAQGFIDTSRANEILAIFPELEEAVASFNAGLIDSTELFDLLEQAYKDDEANYAQSIAIKNQYNDEYYDQWLENLPDWVRDMAESYGIDLENYANLYEQKLALDKEYARRKAWLEAAQAKSEKLNEIAVNSPEGTQLRDQAAALGAVDDVIYLQDKVKEIEELINAIGDTFTVNTSWREYGKRESSFGSSGGSSKADKDDKDKKEEEDDGGETVSTTEIDWIDQSLKVLQENVDDAQKALDDTHGFDAQIEAITSLNKELKKLRTGYKKVKKEYSNRYEGYLSQLANGEEIRKYIESGKTFDLSTYDSNTAEIIQKAIDAYNEMMEAENKVDEITEQIQDNNKLEKSKIRQEKYETKLAGVQIDLENDNLTASEKNKLLKKQLDYQTKINNELIKQAEYEGDVLEVENLKKENKKNELDKISEHWQNKIDENQNAIDAKKAQLENGDLTESEIDDIYSDIEDLTENDYKYKFKQIIKQLDADGNKWTSYINDLKKQYGQENVKTKKFVQEHFQEIAEYFSYTGMEELYYDFINSIDDFSDSEYDNHSNTRAYYINNNNNKLANIQSDIDYAGGRGTKEQYLEMQSIHKDSIEHWKEQKKEAQSFLNACTEGTEDWDKWNTEVQKCDDSINACEKSIKDCNIEILKLPLNDIDDELRDISNQLYDINDQIEDYNTYISAANFILDTQIKNQTELKDAIQDEVDKLQKANELRETNLALQQAEYNLEKLRNQKTEKVFKEGIGFVYETNVDELKAAQKEYDDAIYNKKLTDYNQQINLYDEEIKRLNKIKDKWSEITTNAQGTVDLNKALSYDSNFFNKVLTGDVSIIDDIQNNMTDLFVSKDDLEEKEEKYQRLQSLINDVIKDYELEAIKYEEANKKISELTQIYFPELASKYSAESSQIQDIIDKKKTNETTTDTTSKNINTTVEESNKKLIESYTTFKDDLGKIFEDLNAMLQTYADNTKTMVTSISTAITQLQNQITNLPSVNASVSIDSNTTVDKSSNKTSSNKNKTTVKTAGKSHSGLELGYIGEGNLSQDKKDFKYLALTKLKDDEVVRVLQKNEAVLTEGQLQNVMSNFRKLTKVNVPTVPIANSQSNKSVNFNGDIIVQDVQNPHSFAKAIRNQLPNIMFQELYK